MKGDLGLHFQLLMVKKSIVEDFLSRGKIQGHGGGQIVGLFQKTINLKLSSSFFSN